MHKIEHHDVSTSKVRTLRVAQSLRIVNEESSNFREVKVSLHQVNCLTYSSQPNLTVKVKNTWEVDLDFVQCQIIQA